VQIFNAFLHVIWCYLFAVYLKLGLSGIAIAMNINIVVNIIVIFTWVTYFETDLRDAWFLPDAASVVGIGDYFKMGSSACILLSLEWWALDILIFLAAFIST
jgi:hypothetical protein